MSYKNTLPNSDVFGIGITPLQAITALCIERFSEMGHGDHMAIMAHMVAGVLILGSKHTFLNSSVFGICVSPSQAMMALCIWRF